MSRWTSEWLLLRRDRTAWLVYSMFVAVCAFAVADSVWAIRREASLHLAFGHEEAERMAALRQELATPSAKPLAPWTDPANPGAVGRGRAATYALLPQTALSCVRSHTSALTAVAVSTDGGALDRALGDLTQAHVQSIGRFDLGFLMLVVLPLVVLLLCFDVIVRDHERGTLRLLLAQETNPRLRYAARVTMRVAPLVVMTTASVMVAVSLAGTLCASALLGLGAVFAAVGLYALFWASISILIQSWFRTASASGIMNLAAWAMVVVLLPTVLSAIAEATIPIPSRIERTAASREAARRASIQAEGLMSRYLEDHPELAAARVDNSDYYVRRVALDDAVAAARAPIERRFFDALEQRRELTRRMALASPASLLAITLDELAGSSDERVERFRREVDAFQARFAAFFNDKTMRDEHLSVASLSERPEFHFEDSPATMWTLTILAAWALTMFGLATLRFPRSVGFEDTRAARAVASKVVVNAG